MGMKELPNKELLLNKLPKVKYEAEKSKGSNFLEKMSMTKALLELAKIDHDHEYDLCRQVAGKLLESIPEPDDTDLDED